MLEFIKEQIKYYESVSNSLSQEMNQLEDLLVQRRTQLIETTGHIKAYKQMLNQYNKDNVNENVDDSEDNYDKAKNS